MKLSGIITLTTDFGLIDPYAGIMKGVILSINPDARVIDIGHQIKAGSIIEGAAIIQEVYQFFPKGTIHLVVVDPGVGSDRRPILVNVGDYLFVGPDNGLFWPIITTYKNARVVYLTKRKFFLPKVNHTFHGRDIFAPVAAHLSRGVDPLEMGATINDPVQLQFPTPLEKEGALSGQVIRVDNFGNLITNIHRKDLKRFSGKDDTIIKAGDIVIEGIMKTYAGAKEGELLALIGSSDCLEIAVNLGRACDRMGRDPERLMGMEIEVRGSALSSNKWRTLLVLLSACCVASSVT
ncbi:MAG: SAM-dependent chlorinase/fluorinase [Desulfobacterales bacterium]|nr:SAM-dependent chlorinase/fluorinase [Desulfobacterales bacterium]